MNRRELFGALGAIGAGVAVEAAAADHEEKDESGTAMTAPVNGPHLHFCGIHVAKKDPKFQLIVQHYCSGHTSDRHGEDMFQCILFDSCGKNARLLGVEYVIPDVVYRRLPKQEKKYWHPHTYEVLAGGLVAPGMKPDDETKFMKALLTTWGKTWHTWPDPTTAVPIGEPLLMWAVTGDGQIDGKVLSARDKQFGVSAAELRKRRGKEIGYDVPQVAFPKSVETVGRQWTERGDDKPTRKP